jgi:hypothetical protein
MTTPTLSDKLGDFFTVQLTPKLPVPIVNGIPGAMVTLANQDLVNNVTISRSNSVAGGATIPPLGSVTVDMGKTIWGLAPANTLPLLVFPGGGSWAPSPAQVAASINALGLMKDTTGTAINGNVTGVSKDVTVSLVNTTLGAPAQDSIRTAIPDNIAATGVPLLNLKQALQNVTGTVITTGATNTFTTITGITQPSFNLHVTATGNGAATKPWYTVRLNWIDSATGLVVQVDAFTTYFSNTGSALTTVISGPTDADSLQIQITNNDTLSLTINQLFVFMSSRPNYTYDFYYHFWTGASMPNIPTFQNGASDSFPTNRVIFDLSRTLGIGVTTTPDYAMPSYAGQAMIHFQGGSSNQWTLNVVNAVTGTRFYNLVTAGTASSTVPVVLPRMPLHVNVTNNGSVLGNFDLEITAV